MAAVLKLEPIQVGGPRKAAGFVKSCGFIGDIPARRSIDDDAVNYT